MTYVYADIMAMANVHSPIILGPITPCLIKRDPKRDNNMRLCDCHEQDNMIHYLHCYK